MRACDGEAVNRALHLAGPKEDANTSTFSYDSDTSFRKERERGGEEVPAERGGGS